MFKFQPSPSKHRHVHREQWKLFIKGFLPTLVSGKEPTCQCRRHRRLRFDPWVGKIPCRRAWQPTPVFLSGKIPWTEEPGELQSMGLKRVRHDWATKHPGMRTCSHAILTLPCLMFDRMWDSEPGDRQPWWWGRQASVAGICSDVKEALTGGNFTRGVFLRSFWNLAFGYFF